MVKLNRIYTRTGDKGETGLGDGSRVPKTHPRVEAYGAVDELNAAIGCARADLAGVGDGPLAELDGALSRVQNDLFDLGADLCTPETDADLGYEPLRISPDQGARLEAEIDALNADLEPLNSFVLPAGERAAAQLHLARTICRRAERRMLTLAAMEGETVSQAALIFVNRLSDYLFVASRWVNRQAAGDVLWTPGANR
ncbi:MAG: cob(I)yrinic acid a,c-diamide adenosyltransferase [Pseudomonadota bacterium]